MLTHETVQKTMGDPEAIFERFLMDLKALLLGPP